MKSILRTALTTSFMTIPGACLASWPQTTTEQKVCAAEVIAVGQLSDIKQNYMTVTYNHENDQSWAQNLDLGYIRDARILKTDGVARNERITVLFDSKDQSRSQFPHMTKHYSAGDSGIWFLWRDRFSGSYLIQIPYSPLPIDQEKDVLKIIKKHKCPKIQG